jgi:hypothetical protein
MTSRLLKSISGFLCMALVATIPLAASSTSIEACGESNSCTTLRVQLFDELNYDWAAGCTQDSDCTVLGGNPKDCTGVLTCEFAVTNAGRESAYFEELLVGQQSQGCYLCAVPSCVDAPPAFCNLAYTSPVKPFAKGLCMLTPLGADGGGGVPGAAQ